MCTYPSPTAGLTRPNTVFDNPPIELKDQMQQKTASELFSSLQSIYKSWDYRCLAPYSHKNPEKWRTYDMHAYREASNQKMYNKIDKFKFDINFNNWINPKVLARFVRNPQKAWKGAYGFPFTRGIMWDGLDQTTLNPMTCWRRCAQLVQAIVTILMPCISRTIEWFCLHIFSEMMLFAGKNEICKVVRERRRPLQMLQLHLHSQHLRGNEERINSGKFSFDNILKS